MGERHGDQVPRRLDPMDPLLCLALLRVAPAVVPLRLIPLLAPPHGLQTRGRQPGVRQLMPCGSSLPMLLPMWLPSLLALLLLLLLVLMLLMLRMLRCCS